MASFSSNCEMKFWLTHLHLNVTSKRIKLQMWDCAQKKALEKSFNLVTNKLVLKLAKGAEIGIEKTCVFFNSGSSFLRAPLACSGTLWHPGQDFADFEGKKINLSNLQKCPYLMNPLSYTHDFLRENRLYQERLGQKSWSSEDESNRPNQPNQPTRWKNEKVA